MGLGYAHVAMCSFVLARLLSCGVHLFRIHRVGAVSHLSGFARARKVIRYTAKTVPSHQLIQMDSSDLSVAPNRQEAGEHGKPCQEAGEHGEPDQEAGEHEEPRQEAGEHGELDQEDATSRVAGNDEELQQAGMEAVTDEDFAYMQRGFTTEIYKIEIRNIPTYVGFQVRSWFFGKRGGGVQVWSRFLEGASDQLCLVLCCAYSNCGSVSRA